MLKEYEIKKNQLPEIIKSSNSSCGSIWHEKIKFLAGVPIGGVLGD